MQVPHLHSLYRVCAQNANDVSGGRERKDASKAVKTHAALDPVNPRFSFDIES